LYIRLFLTRHLDAKIQVSAGITVAAPATHSSPGVQFNLQHQRTASQAMNKVALECEIYKIERDKLITHERVQRDLLQD
jgi:hypothetical protein